MKGMNPFLVNATTPITTATITNWLCSLEEIDPDTGYVYDMKLLSDLIKEHVLNKFDHKNLNLDTVEFKDLNPSAENIAVVIWTILREKIDRKYELIVRLYETERNYVEYDGN